MICFFVSGLLGIIAELYERFLFLRESVKQSDERIKQFNEIYSFCTTKYKKLSDPDNLNEAIVICGSFLATLAEMLYREYGRKILVIIDEYDVPLQKAVIAEEPYYNKILEIIRKISVTTFKQNPDPWLYKGIVSGCLRVAHQSVFTDANNFTTFGMNAEPYTGFFGFTEEETHKLLADCGLSEKENEVKEWYDGYRFGDKHIYCPWSLISYCYAATQKDIYAPQQFWVNTSGNDIVSMFAKNSIEAHDSGNVDRLQQFSDRNIIEISLKEFTTYPDINNNMDFDIFMTLMLHTGYATYAEETNSCDKVKIRIPNNEVALCFKSKFENFYTKNNHHWFNQTLSLVDLLMENKTEEAQPLISTMLKSS